MDDYDELDAAALAVLREHGPLTDEDWTQRLVDQGHGTFEEIYGLVETFESHELGWLVDGRNLALGGLLEGRILTHRLREREIASDIIETTNDLTPIAGLLDHEGDTSGFETILGPPLTSQKVFDDRGFGDARSMELGLLLPRGTLDGYAEGELVGLYVEDGVVRLRRVSSTRDGDEVSRLLRELVPAGRPEYGDSVVWQMMHENPSVLRQALPPLNELFEQAGLDVGVDHVERKGAGQDRQRTAEASDYPEYGDDAAAAARLMMLVQEVAATDGGNASELVRGAIIESPVDWDALAEPSTALVVLHLIIRMNGGVDALAVVARELAAADLGLVTGTAHWLRGKALELADDVAEAERSFARAVDHDPWFEPALIDLATYKSLRGDAVGALGLLDQVGDGDVAPFREVLQHFVPRDHPELGRNDRCWCGSGRKYKVCHLGKSEATTGQKATWLYHKAVESIVDGRGERELEELAELRLPNSDDPLGESFADPFLLDVLLVEGGFFSKFVDTFGSLLPAEELIVAQQWLLIERTVYDIESVDPGVGLSLRDIRTGDRVSVTEKTASLQLQPGQFVCARVLPVGDELQFFGGIEPVYPTQRTDLIALLDLNPVPSGELVEFLSARLSPPRVVTKQGDPLVVCEATFELHELGNIKRKLSRRYGASRSGVWHWTVDDSVFGELELDGTALRIEAMSEPRFDELVDAVREMAPQATVLSESRDDEALAGPRRPSEPVEHDPEILAILDERIRQHEASWIHESIPALDGYTPTEAAADPTRRDDLVRLLATFPDTGRPGTMSPSRLRAALGLDGGSSFWQAQKR